MQNQFDRLSEISVERPKLTIVVGILSILILSSFARFIVFDNSEDAFYPENETTDLMYQIEDEYSSDADLIRIIVRLEEGSLNEEETWNQLAQIESTLVSFESFDEHQIGIFGGSSSVGLASSFSYWEKVQDPGSDEWSDSLIKAIENVEQSQGELLQSTTAVVFQELNQVPNSERLSPEELRNWETEDLVSKLERFDNEENNKEQIELIIEKINLLSVGRNSSEMETIAQLQGVALSQMYPLLALQDIPLRPSVDSLLPNEVSDHPWEDGYATVITLAIDRTPEEWGFVTETELVTNISELVNHLEEDLIEQHDQEISVFSFSKFEEEQAGNVGAEIGMLTSASILVLAIILWWQFRSIRDTALVISLTLLAILATYGMAGIFRMEFNAAMNSIPILLLAIGVDYGLHVVLRYREELRRIAKSSGMEKSSIRDLPKDLRNRAIKTGTILTSSALIVAITTDILGFLSFRLSSQKFLVVFGTVIAIGLFFIYLLSITVLPACLSLSKGLKKDLNKSINVSPRRFEKWTGEISTSPFIVFGMALLITLPIGYGITNLEIGFDFRDQLDDEIPVVADFLYLNDEFGGQNQPPLYVVFDGEAITPDGRTSVNNAIAVLNSDDSVFDTVDLWSTLQSEATRNPELQIIMNGLTEDGSGYAELENWLLYNNSGRSLSDSLLSSDGQQTVIQFQSPTLDWQDTVDFESDLSKELGEVGEYKISGRGLILAQVSEDVAKSAVASTGIVAGVILVILIMINLAKTQQNWSLSLKKGFAMWTPLAIIVIWIYGFMGWFGYQLNSQTVTIGALTLGLGVDYAVHFTTRIDEEIEHNPTLGISEWVTQTNSTTGRAMAAAALTTAGGFAVLNLSSLLPLRLFGQVFVVAIVLAWISSTILLPSVLNTFGLIPSVPTNLGESE
jgi:hypothetical protein